LIAGSKWIMIGIGVLLNECSDRKGNDEMSKPLTEKQIQAKNENDRERLSSGFMLKQRAFLKLYMITMTEEKRLYGLKLLEVLREEFKGFGYRPNSSEVYKSLHDLIDDGILEQVKEGKEGTNRQVVFYYRFKNVKKAKEYKNQLEVELHRCNALLNKAIKDNFSVIKKRTTVQV